MTLKLKYLGLAHIFASTITDRNKRPSYISMIHEKFKVFDHVFTLYETIYIC